MGWFDEFTRYANVTLACVCMAILLLGYFRDAHRWNHKTRAHFYALAGLVFAAFVGSLESVLTGSRPGSRIYILFIALVVLLYALTRKDTLEAREVLRKRKS